MKTILAFFLLSGSLLAQFNPATIPGLQLWLDARTITGKTDGDALSYADWNDSSSNSNNPTAGSAIYATTWSGRAAAYFDGSSKYFKPINPANSPCTVVAVVTQYMNESFPAIVSTQNGGVEFGMDGSTPSLISVSRAGIATFSGDKTLPTSTTSDGSGGWLMSLFADHNDNSAGLGLNGWWTSTDADDLDRVFW